MLIFFFINYCFLLFYLQVYSLFRLFFLIMILFLLYFFIFFLLNFNFSFFNYEKTYCFFNLMYLNTKINFFFDLLTIYFIILIFFIGVLCILIVWNLKYKIKEILLFLFIIIFFLINFFTVDNIVMFYVYFEILTIPMFLIIGIWGSRERRIQAAYQFFLYTFLGSFFLLFSILFILSHFGSTNFWNLNLIALSFERQLIFWIFFFIAISIKIPNYPVHIWLPEAHVEAPTIGSIILASLILKLGFFGLIKIIFPFFSFITIFISPFILNLTFISIVYGSFTILSQIDLKKIIAYSSIIHMNFILMGFFSFFYQSIVGSLIFLLVHSLVTTGLFALIGILYDRYKTRLCLYYGGLLKLMPVFSIFFFLILLSNMNFPGTLSFIAEILIFFGLFCNNLIISFFILFLTLITVSYSLLLYIWVCNGSLKKNFLKNYADLTKREFFILIYIILLLFFFGIFPNFLLFNLEIYSVNFLENILWINYFLI